MKPGETLCQGCDFDFCGDCHALAYSGKALDRQAVQLVLLDIPSDGAYYMGEPGVATVEGVQDFVEKFKTGSLVRKQL